MARYFALTAQEEDKRERTCALVPASDMETAAVAARELRKSGSLSFVERGATFRLRFASRTETSLLTAFMLKYGGEATTPTSGRDTDGLLHRRQRMLISFFLALYLDIAGLKRLVGPVTPGSSGGDDTSGGQQSSLEMAQTDQDHDSSENDGVASLSTQEDALAALLETPAANDGGSSRNSGVVMDFL